MNVKQKLLSNQKVSGTMIRMIRNPGIAYLAKNAGFDFFMLDCEHGAYNLETVNDIFMTANALGIAGFARVPVGTKEYVSNFLDAGCKGIMVPMTETPEIAEKLVKYAKFAPIGGRGYGGVAAGTGFKGGDSGEVMKAANEEIVTIAQIETKLSVENAGDIASVNGIDVLLIGPADLSNSLGIPGDILNPIELEAIAKVAAACKKHGKKFGIHSGYPLLSKFAEQLDVCMISGDGNFLSEGMQSALEVFKKLKGE